MPKLEIKVYGTATVGDRGQVSIPAEAREALGIQPGDKLLVISGLFGGIVLFPVRVLEPFIRDQYRRAVQELAELVKEGGQDEGSEA